MIRLSLILLLVLTQTTVQAQEISRAFTVTSASSRSNPPGSMPDKDTVIVQFPAGTAKDVLEQTGLRADHLGISFLILNPYEGKYVAIFTGDSFSSKGHNEGVKIDRSLRFCPLLAVADGESAYGLGLYVIRNNLTKKAVIVRVEFEIKHNVRIGGKQVQMTGLTRWGKVQAVPWDTIEVGDKGVSASVNEALDASAK